MSVESVRDYLIQCLLDEEFRNKAIASRPDSLDGFDLSEEEKKAILNMGPTFFEDVFRSLRDPVFRVGFIRSILFVGPPPTERVAFVPPWGSTQQPDFAKADPQADKVASAVALSRAQTKEERSRGLQALVDIYQPQLNAIGVPGQTSPSQGSERPDIYIVGLGINGFDQVTPEVRRALNSSNEVLFVGNGLGTEGYLTNLCPKVTDLMNCYEEGEDRLNAYKEMAVKVIESALDHPPVTLAEYGHPTMFSLPPFIIEKMANALGLKIKLYPGISALDCILAELMVDPCTNGLQMFEATDLLLRRRALQPDISAIIWQVGSLETALYSSAGSRPERFFNFTNYLLGYYPAWHEVTAIYSSNFPLVPSTVYRFPIARMPELAEQLHPGFTLYIPPATIKETADFQLAHKIRSASHLRSISTET